MIQEKNRTKLPDSKDKDSTDLLYQSQLKRMRESIAKDNELFFESLKDDFINKPLSGQTKEEKNQSKKRLLDYVHRYVFLQRLQPVNSEIILVNSAINTNLKLASFLKYYIFFRNFIGNFFRIRAVLLIFSAVFFFFIEFFFHYYFSFSFKEINVTFQDFINKIPPFF